jgi:uncharacterized membrane protein YkgB
LPDLIYNIQIDLVGYLTVERSGLRQYEAQALIPYISHGPLIFWMYPVFGIKGACSFLGVAEWLFGVLLFAGFWNKTLGILGALVEMDNR